MRYLRTTMFAVSYDAPPVTTIMSEADVTDTLEGVRQQFLADEGPACFYIFEIATDESEDLEVATANILMRMDQNRERNMAILYFWTMNLLPMMRENGVIATPDPSPLTTEEITAVFEQIAQKGGRTDVSVTTGNETASEVVQLIDGKVQVQSL